MSTATHRKSRRQIPESGEPCFTHIEVTDESITACLSDGRRISLPLWWSWRLEQATPEQRNHWEISGAGHTAHWPDVDEHLSVNGFLNGTPAPRPRSHTSAPA
jgi:hypothetical protein